MYFKGKEYKLEKKTLRIAQLIDRAEHASSVIEAYEREYEVVIAALGETATAETLGTDINDIDLTEMVLIYNAIIDEYDKPILEAQKKKEAELFNSPAIKAISKVSDSLKEINNAAAKIK